MRLGKPGEQVVLISQRSFGQIEFIEHEIADYREYYYKRTKRDLNARAAYKSHKKDLQQLMNDVFVLDIIREDMQQSSS